MDYNILFERIGKSTSGFTRHYAFLLGLIRGIQPEKVLELGCGFSSIVIAEALRSYGGHFTTIDMRDINDTGNSEADLERYKNVWTYLRGDSQEVLRTLPETGLDLVLHDGAHDWKTVLKDLRLIAPKMKKNGVLLVHDTLHPKLGRGMRLAVRLGLLFTPHEKVTLPYGYGLTLVRITKDFGQGTYKDTWEKKTA